MTPSKPAPPEQEKNAYLVAFAIADGRPEQFLAHAITHIGGREIHSGLWGVSTSNSAKEVYDAVSASLVGRDSLIVVPAGDGWSFWFREGAIGSGSLKKRIEA